MDRKRYMVKMNKLRKVYNNYKIYKNIRKLNKIITKIGMLDTWIFLSSDCSLTAVNDKINYILERW